ncbi:MAG: 23S rRNA (pseudouridine(1915)-N(3))-methyltransferase RlmH [Desulfopila sp.]
MKHKLIFLGKTKDGFIAEGVRKYLGRLRHYTDLSLITVKEKKSAGQDNRDIEGEQLLGAVPEGWLTIALDPGGRQYSSEGFAEVISGWEQQGVKGGCYLIGGPTGLAEKVLKVADLRLSLSKMTFTHEMARLLLLEQIYRAYTIKGGERYHK